MKKWWILGGSIIGCLVAAPVVFGVVVVLLNMIGKAFGMSYEMTNIVIYYILIPLIWLAMLVIFAYRAKKVLYWILVGVIGFINYCILDIFFGKGFMQCTDYLFSQSCSWCESLPGSYVFACVYSCVIVPILITFGNVILILRAKKYHSEKKIQVVAYLVFLFFINGLLCNIMLDAECDCYTLRYKKAEEKILLWLK